jgi:hypothetical protein
MSIDSLEPRGDGQPKQPAESHPTLEGGIDTSLTADAVQNFMTREAFLSTFSPSEQKRLRFMRYLVEKKGLVAGQGADHKQIIKTPWGTKPVEEE